MRMTMDTLTRYQPLTKLGVALVISGLALTVYGWFWFSESRSLVARGKHGIAEIEKIRRMSGDWGRNRFRATLEMHTETGRERITYYYRGSWNKPGSEGERISIVYLPETPGVFQFGKRPYLNFYGLGGGLLMLVIGIVLPIIEKRRESAQFQRTCDAVDHDEPLSETEERHLFHQLDLDGYHEAVDSLMGAGFGFLGNATPINVSTKGGSARLERRFRSMDAVAVLYVIQPGFLSQLAGGRQKIALELISLLADGAFIITTNYESGHENPAERDNVILVQMPESLDAAMLKEAHDLRLRENESQRGASVVPIKGREEADKLFAGLADLG